MSRKSGHQLSGTTCDKRRIRHWLGAMIPAMDRLLFNAVTRGWPPARIEGYIDLLKVDDPETTQPSRASKRRSSTSVISRTFQLIDTKASGLLTHTSMMVAALGVAGHLVAESHLEEGVILVEIMLYLLVAVMCLRCMAIFNEHTFVSSHSD